MTQRVTDIHSHSRRRGHTRSKREERTTTTTTTVGGKCMRGCRPGKRNGCGSQRESGHIKRHMIHMMAQTHILTTVNVGDHMLCSPFLPHLIFLYLTLCLPPQTQKFHVVHAVWYTFHSLASPHVASRQDIFPLSLRYLFSFSLPTVNSRQKSGQRESAFYSV